MTDVDVRGYRLEVYRDPDDGAWAIEVPELPGCVAGGPNLDDALAQIQDSIEAWIEAAEAQGRPVPAPRALEPEFSGRLLLRLPKSLHRRAAEAAEWDGVSLNTYCVSAIASSVGAGEPARPIAYARDLETVIGTALRTASIAVLGGSAGYQTVAQVVSPHLGFSRPSTYALAKFAESRG